MKNKPFLGGAVILAGAGIITKFIGYFLKVPLTSILGLEGFAFYNYPYYLYTTLLAISIIGLPVAISKLVSERIAVHRYADVQQILKVGLWMMLFVGIFTSAVLLLGAKFIVKFFWPPGAYYSLIGLAFSPMFLALAAVFRGYFQGMQLMMPTALSQIFESFGKLFAGLGLAYILLNRGSEYAAGGAAFGTTFGSILALLVLVIAYLRARPMLRKRLKTPGSAESRESSKEIMGKILMISVPISIGALASSMMSLIDSLMVNSRLTSAGFTSQTASELYGQLAVGTTMINFPLVISVAIATSLVPSIAEAQIHGAYEDIRNKLSSGLKMGIYLALPASIGLILLANPILRLVFPTVDAGGEILQLLSIALFFMTLNQIYTSVLQGLGRVMIPVKNLFIGSGFKIIVSFFLTAHPLYNIQGAAIGTIVGYFVVALLNYRDIQKYTGFKIQQKDMIIKPLIAVTAMSFVVFYTFNYFSTLFHSNTLSTLAAIAAGTIVYGFVLLLVGGIKIKELRSIF